MHHICGKHAPVFIVVAIATAGCASDDTCIVLPPVLSLLSGWLSVCGRCRSFPCFSVRHFLSSCICGVEKGSPFCGRLLEWLWGRAHACRHQAPFAQQVTRRLRCFDASAQRVRALPWRHVVAPPRVRSVSTRVTRFPVCCGQAVNLVRFRGTRICTMLVIVCSRGQLQS